MLSYVVIVILCVLNFTLSFWISNNFDYVYFLRTRFSPNWNSLDSRSVPLWYDEAKIGIFIHWGIYSVPGVGSEWFWKEWKDDNEYIEHYMKHNYAPNFTYQEFASSFTGEFFNPNEWANLFESAGAKYVVLTTKHHDGFTLFPSKRSFGWNALDIGPKMDIVGLLSVSVRNKGLKFGVYYSLLEWYNPLYIEDKANNFTTDYYVQSKLLPDLKQLVNDYEPSILWSDGDWEGLEEYWKSTDFLAWLYNESPVKDEILVNDRWGRQSRGHHGDFYNFDDRYNPGKIISHKWENAFTIDKNSWGFRKNMNAVDTLNISEILYHVASTVSCGGNVLINVGPTQYGKIPPIFQERLLDLGKWLSVNGEAIYSSVPWKHQCDSQNKHVWYTYRKITRNSTLPNPNSNGDDAVGGIYAIFLSWPKDNWLKLYDVTPYLHSDAYKIKMLGNDGDIDWKINSGITSIQLPNLATVVSQNAWVLKIYERKNRFSNITNF